MINAQFGPREGYTNLQITISGAAEPQAGRPQYRVQSEILHGRGFDDKTLVLDLDQLLSMKSDPTGYGLALGKALFANEVLGPDYGECLAVGQSKEDGLRVRLVVKPPELRELFWERIYQPVEDDWLPLGSTATTPFSRFSRPSGWTPALPVTERPLRLLLVMASPSDLAQSGLAEISAADRTWLRQTLEQLPDLAVTTLESGTPEPPTLDNIREKLASGVHLVHFLCHGLHSNAGTALLMEKKDGTLDIVNQERLLAVFQVLKTPPAACFLSACESARHDQRHPMLPLGPLLVEDGRVQAVVAMTDNVGMKVAQQFAGQFYTRLLQHGVVDLAVNEARALVQDDWDWGVPVLFSALEDNQLIDFPVGSQYRGYLEHTDQAYHAVDQALNAARVEDHGQELVDNLELLVKELSKSHGVLVDLNSKFRRTGRDPLTFAQNFEAFYFDFKDYFDGETWIDENTNCTRIRELGSRILPKLSPLLKPILFSQLRQEIDYLGDAHIELVQSLSSYLDSMNQAVEEVWSLVKAGKMAEAIAAKQNFEDQITPGMKVSKEMFQRMSHGIGAVSKA